jgi:branched-chain amino acid transport system substrate-binding protein
VLASAGGQAYSLHYVKSWTSMLVMAEALKRAKKAGKLDGPGLKAALETIKDFDTGGLTAPISYAADDHRPNTTMSIYGVAKGGKLEKVKEVSESRDPANIGK